MRTATDDPRWLRLTLIGTSLIFVTLFLVLPLSVVFVEALRKGLRAYFASFRDPAAWQAIRLTLWVSALERSERPSRDIPRSVRIPVPCFGRSGPPRRIAGS